ncbi:hypothetical protein K1T71_006644 [Dendrolimus kikuchii]|uniref:Uncharacterized protein n=1 Tax=Dendrolimus kikuchii TaxID=765133 RepID=A0ACC1D1Q8_9NEOP|nr:hypothetical protein K1T71_006644 [Dendrolimus kikuchii]
MDENFIKRCCPNCSQPYRLKSLSPGQKENFPLFLKCGHGICENCIRNIIKFIEPIECKICHQDMEIDASKVESVTKSNIEFYELFPINLTMFGELALQFFQNSGKNTQKAEETHFLDLQSILQGSDVQAKCLECDHLTATKCKQCTTNLCKNCFDKTHKSFLTFKNHVLQDIDSNIDLNECKIHKGKILDYFCKNCDKAICVDCTIVGGEKSCQKHEVVAMQEMNETLMEELSAISPKVSETFKRLTKTAVDIGTMLYNIDNGFGPKSDLTKSIVDIEQHFSKLFAVIYKKRQELIKTVIKLKRAEQQSLKSAKNDIANHIKKAYSVMKTLETYSDPDNYKQVNLSLLLEKAEEVVDTPWYLKKDETSKEPIKIIVNEDLCNVVSDYVHLEGNESYTYKLYSTSELGDIELPPPPKAPVYPPEFPRDVREINKPNKVVENNNKENQKTRAFYPSAPKYRAKSASISSLNSTESDKSSRNYLTLNDGNQKARVQPDMIFKDSQQTDFTFKEGSQELIYISHIVDPHNFYVQRACHQRFVKDMLQEFKNAATLPKPSINHATEGKIYLAYNKADKTWQRCRVLSIDKRDANNYMFHVFCIDFGSTERLSIDNLRLLPPARVQNPVPLATHCSLANCVPKSVTWTQEDSLLVLKIIDNKQAVIHVRNIRCTSNYIMSLEVDLMTFEEGVNIADALVFHERAKMLNPRQKCTKISGITEKPKIFMSHSDFKYKAIEQVHITHIQSPDKFFVRKRHFYDTYDELSQDLIQEYCANDNKDNIYLPEVGMVCVANVEKVKGVGVRWARAVVTALEGRARVRVALPDTGIFPFAINRITRFIITSQTLKLRPCKIDILNMSLGVVLFHKDDDENIICINNEMINHKFAVSFGMFKFNNDLDVESKVVKNKPLYEAKKASKPKHEKVILKKEAPRVIKTSDLEAKDKGPLRLEVKVIQYHSPSLIYFTLVHQERWFNNFYEELQKHYSKKKETADNKNHEWAIGDRCCTICKQSQTWRRAIILEIEGDTATVFYTDFAVTETVPISSLEQLTEEFAAPGDASFKCHLCSVVPAVGEEWPSLTKEYLKELLDAYKRIFITKVGNFKDKSMPVEVWVYHTIPGGALEPDISEWRCLNKKIIEQGLGVPDKEQQAAPSENNADGAPDDDTLSFLNMTGTVRDWLQLDPIPTKTDITASGDSNESSSNVMYITDWLPPEPFQYIEFTAMPTYVDNDGVVYLHDVSQQQTLEMIRQALDLRFKQPDRKAKFVSWTVGEPCIALYFLDKKFYRGRVLEVNNEDKTCLIHYVDYGNEDICSFENLRKTIILHQIPVQAHRCKLDRIVPIEEEWKREILDYLHKSIVEKQCYVKITGEPVDGVIPIDLKYDKLYINDHLVELELAKYEDGSKAVIHKFAEETNDEVQSNNYDSGPDYIIEDETTKSEDSFNMDAIKGRDWNTLLDTDDSTSIDSKYITFVNSNEEEFVCNVFVINDVNSLELSFILDDETTELYQDMFTEVQVESESMPPLNGIIEHKACIALYKEDQNWYRASILQYSETKNQIKVRYVDYGNIGIIPLSDAREIREEWSTLPPGTITARLYDIKLNPEIDRKTLSTEYSNVFLDKGPFHAKVVEYKDSVPYVELKNDEGQLVYQNLIDKNIFFKDSPSE